MPARRISKRTRRAARTLRVRPCMRVYQRSRAIRRLLLPGKDASVLVIATAPTPTPVPMPDTKTQAAVQYDPSYCWMCAASSSSDAETIGHRAAAHGLLNAVDRAPLAYCARTALQYYNARVFPTTRKVMSESMFRQHAIHHDPQLSTVRAVHVATLAVMSRTLSRL